MEIMLENSFCQTEMSKETTVESIVNENILMKIFLSNWNIEQKLVMKKEATVKEISKNQFFARLKHGKETTDEK